MQQNVIVVVDYSPQAEHLVKYYVERVHRPGNKLILVHCVQLPELSISKARDNYMSPGILAQLWTEEEMKRKDLEQRMRDYLCNKKVPGILRSLCGRPGDVIRRIVDETNAAFVVIGDLPAYGGGKVWRAMMTTTGGNQLADYLLSHLPCPLVIVQNSSIPTPKMACPDGRRRHFSGEAIASLTSRLRRIRFASGGSGMASLSCAGRVSSFTSENCQLVADSPSDT